MAESIDLSDAELALILRLERSGWATVPVEPSDWMVKAGEAVVPGKARKVWDAMAAAAPSLGRHVE